MLIFIWSQFNNCSLQHSGSVITASLVSVLGEDTVCGPVPHFLPSPSQRLFLCFPGCLRFLHAFLTSFQGDTSSIKFKKRNEVTEFVSPTLNGHSLWITVLIRSFTFSVRVSASIKAQSLTSSPTWRLWAFIVLPITTRQTLVRPLCLCSYICYTLCTTILQTLFWFHHLCVLLFFCFISHWSGIRRVWRFEPCAVWGCSRWNVCLRGEEEPVWKQQPISLCNHAPSGVYLLTIVQSGLD